MATGKLHYWCNRKNSGSSKTTDKDNFLRKLRLKTVKKTRNSSVVVNKEKKRSWLSWFWMTITKKNKGIQIMRAANRIAKNKTPLMNPPTKGIYPTKVVMGENNIQMLATIKT